MLLFSDFLVFAAVIAGPPARQAMIFEQPPVVIPATPSLEDMKSSINDESRMKLINEELAFGNEELANSWHIVARSLNGSVWFIRGKDLGAWTPANTSVWVKVDHSSDNIIKAGTSLDLTVVDCSSKADGTKLTSTYDKAGKQLGHYIRPGSDSLGKTYPGSPGRAVVEAFCPSTKN